jgi:GNAT superfamily N-acetyltransferase
LDQHYFNTKKLKFRRSNKKDHSVISSFVIESSDGIFDFINNKSNYIYSKKLIELEFCGKTSNISHKNCYLLEYENEIISAIILFPSILYKIPNYIFLEEADKNYLKKFYRYDLSESILIHTLYTKEEYRKNGLATKMIDFAKKISIKNNFYKLCLFVWKENKNAYNFYLNYGFYPAEVACIEKPPDLKKSDLRVLMYYNLKDKS